MKLQDRDNEIKLVSALKKDDKFAFEQLYLLYGKRLYHFAYGYLKSKEESEGLVQEVFFKIWKNRKELKPSLSFKSYIFTIAYHSITELFEKIYRDQKYKHLLLEDSIRFTDDLNEKLNYQLLLEKVEKLISKLPPRQKEILIKRKKQGMAVKEIAKELGISPKTVENHLTEALRNLKTGLSDEEYSFILFLFFARDPKMKGVKNKV